MGMENPTERVNFEKKVIVNGNTKRIDVYIPETHVIIEQKSLGKSLDQKIHNSGDVDLTPYEQAKRYNDNLPYDEKARWIITCNFSDIWIYDMNARVPEPVKIALVELQSKYLLLDFLVKQDVKKLSHEMEVSIKAGDIVGLIYDAFLKQYKIPDGNEKQESAEQKEKREHKLNADLYTFGIITSNVHMAWTRVVCGRLKSDYRYSAKIVYNNFPWPEPTEQQKQKIEETAHGILDARALFPDSSLADLYDPLTMPVELRKAHIANDKAVMAAYGFGIKMTEEECVAELMKLYQKMQG